MVYFPKEKIEPPCLAKEREKKNGNYRCKDVVNQLHIDFHSKCYLCEDKPQSINVEHFKAKKGIKGLTFDWKNLFNACSHCNGIKSTLFDEILNCTEVEHIDSLIRYDIKPFPNEKVKLSATDNNAKTTKTIELLELIYNSNPSATPMRKIQSANLRERLIDEIYKFGGDLQDYDDQTLPDEYRERAKVKIQGHLSNKSLFTAFKRWIIRENEHFNAIFGQYCCK